MRLLLVEDDEQLARRLSDRLRGAALPSISRNRAEGEDWPDMDKMAAVILDLGLPDGTGMDLLRLACAPRRMPDPDPDRARKLAGQVEGLNAGADDFVVKPVRFEELLARLNALFRRHAGKHDPWLEEAGIRLDPVSRTVLRDGEPLVLSKQEFRLLQLFLRRAGQVLSQGDIIEHLYDLDSQRELNAVEVLVSRLRRKIGRDRITTLRGLGYRFER
jgi:two-component system OmpR family response regulator